MIDMSATDFLNRTVYGEIAEVDPANGWVRIRLHGHSSQPKVASIPLVYGSFPRGGAPAWIRVIPSEGDGVRVSFDAAGRPTIVGWDPRASAPGVADGASGWPAFRRFYEERENGGMRWADWRTLKRGEWDMRSSGGAYIFGSDRGVLHARGGNGIAVLELDGPAYKIYASTSKFDFEAGPSRFYLGEVRRSNASTGFIEAKAVPGAPAMHPQELDLNLNDDSGTPTRSVRVAFGTPAVYQSGLLVPEVSTMTATPGAPLAALIHKYPPGIPDGTPATPIGGIEMGADGSMGIRAPSVNVVAPVVQLNTPTPVPGVTGVVREQFLTDMASAIGTAITATNAALMSLSAAPTPTGAQVAAAFTPIMTLLSSLQASCLNPASKSSTTHVGA